MDDRDIIARDWITDLHAEVRSIVKEKAFARFLSPVPKILREGNTARQWMK